MLSKYFLEDAKEGHDNLSQDIGVAIQKLLEA
jgi:hypothetical protein